MVSHSKPVASASVDPSFNSQTMTPQQFLAQLGHIFTQIGINNALIQKTTDKIAKDEVQTGQQSAKLADIVLKALMQFLNDAVYWVEQMDGPGFAFERGECIGELASDCMNIVEALQSSANPPQTMSFADSIKLEEQFEKSIRNAIKDFKEVMNKIGGNCSPEEKVLIFILLILKEFSKVFKTSAHSDSSS
jgi:hypothetical protein